MGRQQVFAEVDEQGRFVGWCTADGTPLRGGDAIAGGAYAGVLTLPAGFASLRDACPNAYNSLLKARCGEHVVWTVAGDSTDVGFTGTYVGMKAFGPLTAMARSIAAGLGVRVNTQNFMADNFVSASGGTAQTYNPQITMGAGWSAVSLSGLGGTAFINTTNNSTTPITWQCTEPVRKATFFYVTNGTALSDLEVDIGGAVLGTMPGTTSPAGATRSITVDFGFTGLHTVNIRRKALSGVAGCYFLGMDAWDDAYGGISLLNVSFAGLKASNLSSTASGWHMGNAWATLGADLVFAEAAINDGEAAVTAAARGVSRDTFITQARRGGAADVIWFQSNQPAASQVPLATQQAYWDSDAAMVNAMGVPLLNLRGLLGVNDGVNPNYVDVHGHGSKICYAKKGFALGATAVAGFQ